MQQAENADGYVLERTEAEYRRLRTQAEIWAPFTERVLKQAGMTAGMNVLDAGCGPGEVMRLMNRCVGPSGHVTGVDIDAEVGPYGLARLNAEETGNFSFHSADLTAGESVPGSPFDVVYCRFFLIHMADPVDAVAKLAALLKPGGTLIAMDYVMNTMQIAPAEPTMERGIQLVLDVFEKSGKPLDCGVRLGEYFTRAGLPMPLGTDVEGKLEISGRAPPMLASVLESLSVPAEMLGLCPQPELRELVAGVREIAEQGQHAMHWPTVTAAWTVVPH